ncbi:MAG: acyl-CoA thioesterase [Bacteroidetes bacterium]|nr:acyl-CoA thioesterase [Bacteroidota bacterium]
MARLKLEFPGNHIATFQIPVRITDINYGNHVGNDAFVSIIHEARMQWLNNHGYTELNIGGPGLIMADIAVEFKSESFYGDIIDVSIATGDISKISFELYYKLSTTRNDGEIMLAVARTGMVCFDYQLSKVAAIPGQLQALLQLH